MDQGQPPVSASHLTCVQCGYNLTGVAVGGTCPECGARVDESMHAFGRGNPASGTPLPTVSYVGPILATIFCCVIGGIVSIVYAAKANTAAATGNHADYHSAVSTRKGWLIASIVIGLLISAGQVGLLLAAP